MKKLRLCILYGSQTGTAQDIAEEIWRQSKKYNFDGPVLPMDDYKIENLIKEKLVIFICSTTGQGDEPDNMKLFWKFLLRKSLPLTSLQDMNFCVLGLGDSSYPKFNFTAKRLNKRLLQLSGKQIIPLGLCDDQHDMGPSFVYLKWIEELWSKLKDIYYINEVNSENSFILKYKINEIKETIISSEVDMKLLLNPSNFEVHEIEVVSNERTTAKDHFQDVRLISFSCENLNWNPGDVLLIKPCNSDEIVNNFFALLEEQHLSFNRNTVVNIQSTNEEMVLPQCFSQTMPLELIVKYIWDLNSVPRQSFFKLLSLNCPNELEKEKLLEFSTPEGLDDMLNYAIRPKRTILEILNDFPHAVSGLTLEIIFELLPAIKPRSFSIASVPETKLLQLLIAVVEYKTILKSPRKGLCSNWLKNLNKNDKVLISIKSGTVKIPKDLNIPMVMVGPGTGVAPFRSILLQKELNKQFNSEITILFFGCRNQHKDFHCKEDWDRMTENGVVTCFFAFSRDQENKRYVQHVIEEQSDLIKDLIQNKNGIILVAGNSKNMPSCVRDAFSKILGGTEFIEKLIKNLKYQEETW